MEILGNALLGLITGGVGAIIAALISMRKFYSEKWWEKRAELFIELVNCLYELKKINYYWYCCELEKNFGYDSGHIRMDSDGENELQKKYMQESEKLKRIKDLSPLLLTDKCASKIDNYLNSEAGLGSQIEEGEMSTFDAHELNNTGIEKLFDDIIQEAKKVLKNDNLENLDVQVISKKIRNFFLPNN